ncbi:hypothetical protein SAMN04488126_101100 [Bhargavaea beijingensis]|uniref:Uncharacterized protein n=1 Tax=Bhargavaea beijingensis TaxID=426756 RepID=A0A1G6XMN6_9BACL|nr:hypothetical protein [Bhargavaea beijingensis]SDD79013.1 hypothetical protein SAMN04488126_101100 [Bhargavaea beijingensis]
MRELVGTCESCGRDVFCLDGFLNGVSEAGRLECFECADREEGTARPQDKEKSE